MLQRTSTAGQPLWRSWRRISCHQTQRANEPVWAPNAEQQGLRPKMSWRFYIGIAMILAAGLHHPTATLAATIDGQPPRAHTGFEAQSPGEKVTASSQGVLAVTYHAGLLSVRAERVPLARLLQEVAQYTKLDIHGLSALHREVSVQFTDLPLLDGLRRLLAHVNYLLRIERAPQGGFRDLQVVVFGRDAAPPFQGGSLEAVGLRQALADTDPRRRRWAVERLGEGGEAQAFRQLRTALDDVDPGVRQGALASLSQYGARGLEPLQTLLQREQDNAVRLAALQTLGQISTVNRDTVPLLRAMLADDDPRIRAAVVTTLGGVEGARATDALQSATHDDDPVVRMAALQALAIQVHDATAKAVVTQHLTDTDEAVRDGAAALLETFNEMPGDADQAATSP